MNRILIAEDEPRIVAFLEKGLRATGYTTTAVADGRQAAAHARDERFDFMILDLGLPGQDGLAVLTEIRARGERMPVIVLTARNAIPDRVAALDLGADDYITKPFSFNELLARIRARIRERGTAHTHEITVGPLRLDLLAHTAEVKGIPVELTNLEFRLLETLTRHAGQVLTREQILDRVWGINYDAGSNIVDVYVRCLRRKIGKNMIETVRGTGYRIPA